MRPGLKLRLKMTRNVPIVDVTLILAALSMLSREATLAAVQDVFGTRNEREAAEVFEWLVEQHMVDVPAGEDTPARGLGGWK